MAQSKAARFGLIAVRVLFGLVFVFASVAYFAGMGKDQPKPDGNAGLFTTGLDAAGYLMPLVKVIELLTGVLILINRFVPLALLLIAPILTNIFLVHAVLLPSGLPVAIVLVVLWGVLVYAHREAYAPLLKK